MSIRTKSVLAASVAGGMLIGSTMMAAPANAEIERSAQGTCNPGRSGISMSNAMTGCSKSTSTSIWLPRAVAERCLGLRLRPGQQCG